jgi:hypothetical protein
MIRKALSQSAGAEACDCESICQVAKEGCEELGHDISSPEIHSIMYSINEYIEPVRDCTLL